MVKVARASPLLLEAAEVLAEVRDDVVVIGAVAVQVHLADRQVALTPTRDVDAGIATDAAERVVAHLEARGLRRSELEHERPFTWVRDDLKVQLLRPFHPFPKGAARGLPVNNIVSELAQHRVMIAFDTEPDHGRFWIASAAALVDLKEAAFGRTRFTGEPVDRDFSDAALLLDRVADVDRRRAEHAVPDARPCCASSPASPRGRGGNSSGRARACRQRPGDGSPQRRGGSEEVSGQVPEAA